MRRSVANTTRITAILLLWTLLLFLVIIEATTVSPSQDLALNAHWPPAAALIEKRTHKNRHKSTVHQEQHQHADYSESTRRESHHHIHHHAVKKLHPKSTFFRKGRIYIAGRPDWYNHYRQQRGPRNIMRKLTLESSHRRKATLTFPLMGGDPSGSNESAGAADNDGDDNDGSDELGAESKATEDQSGIKGKPAEPEEDGGDGKEEEAVSEDGHEEDEGSRGSQSIQAVKKPQFVGVPSPMSVRHSGIIPKENRCGRVEEHGRLQAWTAALAVGIVFLVQM